VHLARVEESPCSSGTSQRNRDGIRGLSRSNSGNCCGVSVAVQRALRPRGAMKLPASSKIQPTGSAATKDQADAARGA
jgi:hypothetical protein